MHTTVSRQPLPLTLCYVDDDAEDLMIFKVAVESIVKEVKLFRVGADFLNSMQSMPSDSIVFVDLNMQCFTGFQIITFLRENILFKKLPIIVLSTAADRRMQQTSWDVGADFYIVKPSTISELTTALEYVISVDWKTHERKRDEFVFGLKRRIAI